MIGVLLKRSNLDTALHAGKMPSEHQNLAVTGQDWKVSSWHVTRQCSRNDLLLTQTFKILFLTDNLSMFLFGLIIIHWQVFPFPPLGHKEPITGNIDNWLLLHGEYSQDIVFFFFFPKDEPSQPQLNLFLWFGKGRKQSCTLSEFFRIPSEICHGQLGNIRHLMGSLTQEWLWTSESQICA